MSTFEIEVVVYKVGDRTNWVMRYTDPRTGRRITRSTGTSNRRQAERVAGKWESELRAGKYRKSVDTHWPEFRERYEKQVAVEQAKGTLDKVIAVLNAVEESLAPKRVRDIDADALVDLKQKWLESRTPSTVGGYLGGVPSAMTTAVEWGILPRVPKFPKIRRNKGVKLMRGRAVTPEEFDLMLAATPKVVGDEPASSWQFLLRGFWTSGLRLSEACSLYWDGLRGHCVDLTGRLPLFIIRGTLEKGKQDRHLPMAPEFADLLLTVPKDQRDGRVFSPAAKRPGRPAPKTHRIGEIIAAIGEVAGVCVDADATTGDAIKFASAHDLRRAFGERWAKRVMPAVLQTLMRHASIQTTMQYYVSLEAEATAELLWTAVGNSFGNSGPNGET